MKILIVEDEKELSKSIITYLKGESYSYELATDVKKAREKTESYDYDCRTSCRAGFNPSTNDCSPALTQ